MKTLFSALTAKVSAAIIGALAAAIIGLSVTIWGVPLIGGGLLAKLDTARAERDLALSQRDALIADSKRRVNVGREALREAQTVKTGRNAQRARIVVQQAPGCHTPPEAADILDRGW